MRKFIRSRLSAKASDESFCCCGKVEELAEEAYLSSKKSSSRENLRASECVPPPGDKENQPIASSSKGYTPPVFPTHRLYVPPSPRKQALRNSRSLGNLEAIRKEKRKVAQKHVAFVEDGPSERLSSDSTIPAFAQFTPASGYGRFKGTSLSSKDCLPSGIVCLPLRKQASLRVNSESETTIARVLLAQSKHNRAAEDSGKLVAKPKRFRVVLGKKAAQGEAEVINPQRHRLLDTSQTLTGLPKRAKESLYPSFNPTKPEKTALHLSDLRPFAPDWFIKFSEITT
ncbi:hypothetical protein PGT21_015960 [Puccinia graminis f. sp. tritici]|uniref:Uncharacterized protein n=1 Tax=Puccinia graminis f. sp. tritici TaxID=56615 RepID=A0A5B0PSA9_PUCGR|nr:hypothetical protein PGT21_015960 [Puccinia graminis f. sp. tritici]